VFEALSNHRFAVLGLAVETNLGAEQGRGTLKRRLMTSLRAAQWTEQHFEAQGSARKRGRNKHKASGIIVAGSSAKQLAFSNSVRLVITDPPYYDAVQYGELSALFLAWAKVVLGKRKGWEPNLRLEAVPNATRNTGSGHYERLLRSIMKETARTMRSDAKLLLTYHSTDFRGWAALGRALQEAGFRVIALAVAHSENEKDHPKRNRNGFFKDLIIECQKTRRSTSTVVVTFLRESDQRELVAAGLTIAKYGGADYEEMAQEFLHSTRRLKRRRIRVPNSGSR
jgi:adenine-specific DNA methylase